MPRFRGTDEPGVAQIAVGALALLGCGGASTPGPAASSAPAPPACIAEVGIAVERAEELAEKGRLDAALVALERAPVCPEPSVNAARAKLVAAIGPAPDDVGATVREGWQAWLAGDGVTAQRKFSRVVSAGVRAGTSPQPFVMSRGAPSVTRIVGSTFASGAVDVLANAYGAILFDVVRTGAGNAKGAPFRFAKGDLAKGGEGLVLVGDPTLHFASPTGPPVHLPAADMGAVVDEGRIAVLRTKGEVAAAFDLPSGTPRPGPELRIPAYEGEGIPLTEGGNVTLCSSISKRAFSWNPRTNALVQAEGHACHFDARRGLLATLHARPRASGRRPSFEIELEVRALGKATVARVPLGVAPEPEVSYFSSDPETGLVEITLVQYPTRIARWVDLTTGRTVAPAKPKRAPAPGIASLPVGEAGFDADLLRPLKGLERPGRVLLRPQYPSPGNWSAGWSRNAVRTRDGKTIAVIDAKEEVDPDAGREGEEPHLLVATGDPLRVRADVPMRIRGYASYPWKNILVLGERYLAAQWGWTFTVVDLDRGELRATVDMDQTYGNIALAPGEWLFSGQRLYDLSLPRPFDKGGEALIDPGLVPEDVAIKKDHGGVSLSVSKGSPAVRLSATGYELADGIATPGWIHCRLGEWILPREACSHRLVVGRLAPATPGEKPRKP